MTESLALTGDQGIACGIGFAAWMHTIQRFRRDSNGEDRPYRFLFGRVDAPGAVHAIQMTRAFARGLQEDDGLVASESTPFAFRLPAGRYAVALLQIYGLAFFPAPGQRAVYAWSRAPLPPLGFEVRPGEISYVGRIGFFQGVVSFPTRAEADAACRAPDVAFSTIPVPGGCSFRRLAFASQLETDLALIRQRFPTLAAERIVANPARQVAGGWADWAAVRRDPLNTRAGLVAV